MDQNLAIECIEVVENLSQKEKNKILSVLKRDDKLRIGQEQKISQLKQDINAIRKNGILRAGDDQSKMCIRCRAPLGFFFNRGDICPACRFRVCNLCQEVMFNKSWLCKLCSKQRQLKWLTGEWAAFEQNPLRKWASGSDIHRASGSLQVYSGATSIDIGEPDTARTNNNRSSKSAHNGMLSGSDHDKQRVEYPKEADQHKLSQLFGVLRSRKPEETTKELQVRRVSSRKYSETDSDSSSSSDVEAPSVTESELDKTESPRSVESPKSRLEAVDEDLNESTESDRQSKTKGVHKSRQKPSVDIQQEYVIIDKQDTERIVRPKVAHASDRSKAHKAELESNEIKPKHREKKKIVPDQNLARELRIKAEASTKVSQSKSVDINLNEPINTGLSNSRKVPSHSELSSKRLGDPNASKSHESLSRITESQDDRGYVRKSNESLQSDGNAGRDAIPIIRHNAENLSPKIRNKTNQNVRRSHESLGVDRETNIANQNIRQARSHEHLPTGRSQYKDEQIAPMKGSREKLDSNVSQKTIQTPVIDIEVIHANAHDHLLEKEVSSDTGIEGDIDTPRGQRSGSPYSFSMDSLPSSNPSPTLRRSIDSNIPESSDTDSLSKFSHHEEFSGTESQMKEGNEDDFVVEEISQVRFRRISKKAAQMSVLGKMSSSPKKSGTCEDVDHRDRGQWKSQSRGGSGGASYETEIIDEMFEPKSVACVSKSTDNDSETVFEEEIVPSKKQDSKAAIYNTQYKISEGNTENISDSNITVRKDKTNLKRVAIPSLQAEASNRTRSAISSTGSGVDLSWFDEYSMDVKQNISRQTSYTSDVKVFVEDETTRGRIDSDTDSVEGMIDKMTRPHLHVEVLRRPTRPSEADSEGSFNMTPISPLPPDTFETRTGTYTLTYMSDDNLDAVSTDDNIDAGSDIEKQIEPNIEETVEKRVIVGRSEKQTLKAKNSLDLLITKQGNLLEPDQDFVEIDAEFNEALKMADEHDSRKHWSDFGRKDTNGISFQELEIDSQEKNKPVKVHQSKNKAAQVSKKDSYDNVDSSIKSDDFEVQIRAVPGRTAEVRKTKLAPLKSLDLLIFNQGGLVDPRESSVELDAELQAALEQHFQGMQSPDLDLEEVVTVSEKHVDFLGMQLNLGSEAGAKVSGIVHTEKESTHVNKSSEQDITDGTEIVIPPDIVTQRIKLMQENESSEESDILSVIEEEEEFSESSEQPDEGKLKSSATSVLQTPIITKELKEPVEESTVTKSEKNIKLADKVKLMEDKVRQITEVGKSPGHEKHEGYDVKVYSKFKKLQERWNAIEKHEADLLDFDDDTGHATNNINNKKEEVTNYNTSKVPVLGQKSTDKENESVSSVNVNVYSKASTDERLGTGSDINVAEEPTIEETVEKRVIVGRKEKQKLKATHSLDLLLAKQGIFLEPEQDIVAEDSDTEILLAPEKQFAHESKEIDRKEVFGDENFQNILMQTAKSLNISTEISDNSEESLPDTHEAYVDNFDLISKTSVSEVQLRAMPGRRTTEMKRTYGKIGSSEFIEDKVTQDSDIKKTINDDPDDDPIRHSVPVRHYISKADPFRLSINDKNGRCHSLTDLSIDLESSQDETIQEAANEQGQDINIHDSLARCQSSEGEMDTGNVVKSIHESVNECQSIAEDDASAAFYGSDRCISIEEKSEDHVFTANAKIYSEKAEEDASETMHRPLVRLSKLGHGRKVSDPSKKTDFGNLDRSYTYTVKKSLSNSSSKSEHEQDALGTDKSNNNELAEIFGSQKQDEYKEVKEDNFMQTDNKEENDLVFPPEPQCFKVPSIPIKIESRLSSSSVPSSPDLSFDLPFTPVDSPRSDKISSHRASPQTISESSISQDDSGLASGGSRGATPEHKRTDSGYSQSSIQSATLSTVTDRSTEEEEDIEKVVAKVKATGNRGNLLSVVSDSRESIASFYSDAGDIAYSNIPVTGEILFGLNYNYKIGMLEVHIKQCRDIAAVDTKRRRSDPYVKTYLLPDKTRSGKRKTKVKKHTLNPTFDEQLKYSISKSELENRTLWVTVWHNDRFGRNDFLGEVTINFDYYKFDDPLPKWYPLQERLDAQPTSILTYKGDIVLSIRYVPADKVKVTEFKGKSPRKETGPGKGQLHVVVKEARNLTAVRSNGFSDPFCKGYLLPERHRSSKQKTAVIKKNCSPVWNHTFVFEDVSVMELQERCLELTIWDYEKLASNDFLGGVRLNLGTGLSQGRTVDWMDARGEEMSMWQAMLDRPNIWIDGTLILRPNMEKRKF